MSLLHPPTVPDTQMSPSTPAGSSHKAQTFSTSKVSSKSRLQHRNKRWTPYPTSKPAPKPASNPKVAETNTASGSTRPRLSTDFITDINKAANSITGIGNPNVKSSRIKAAKLYVANSIWDQAYKPTSDIEIDIETQQSISNRVAFTETEPNEGHRLGECGEEHRMHVLCAVCEEKWNGLSFEELQEGRLGYLRDGSMKKPPDVLVRLGE